MGLIKEVINHIAKRDNLEFQTLSAKETSKTLIEFCRPVFDYFRNNSDEEIIESFGRKFGAGGVKECRFKLMQIIAEKVPDFGADDFRKWSEQINSDDLGNYNHFVKAFAQCVTASVIDGIKYIHGNEMTETGEPKYWEHGVTSQRVRKRTFEKQLRDTEKKKKEAYLEIVDLIEIVRQRDNWEYFSPIFNNPMSGERTGQKYYTKWLEEFYELSKIATHPNRIKTNSDKQLEFLEWLRSDVQPKFIHQDL